MYANGKLRLQLVVVPRTQRIVDRLSSLICHDSHIEDLATSKPHEHRLVAGVGTVMPDVSTIASDDCTGTTSIFL